jgi:hypothetical protein
LLLLCWIHCKWHQARYTTPKKKGHKKTQLCEILYTDSQDMLVLPSNVASCYYNCCTDGSTSPRNYGHHLILQRNMLPPSELIFNPEDRGCMFLQNISNCPQDYMTSQHRRPQS